MTHCQRINCSRTLFQTPAGWSAEKYNLSRDQYNKMEGTKMDMAIKDLDFNDILWGLLQVDYGHGSLQSLILDLRVSLLRMTNPSPEPGTAEPRHHINQEELRGEVCDH